MLEHAQKLTYATDEQSFLIHLDPGTGRRREDDVVAALYGHLNPNVVPPVEPWANGEHDPLLRRRLVGPRGHEQP